MKLDVFSPEFEKQIEENPVFKNLDAFNGKCEAHEKLIWCGLSTGALALFVAKYGDEILSLIKSVQ